VSARAASRTERPRLARGRLSRPLAVSAHPPRTREFGCFFPPAAYVKKRDLGEGENMRICLACGRPYRSLLCRTGSLGTVAEVGTVTLGRQRAPRYHVGPNMKAYLRVANVFEDRIDVADVMEMHFDQAEFERFRLVRGAHPTERGPES